MKPIKAIVILAVTSTLLFANNGYNNKEIQQIVKDGNMASQTLIKTLGKNLKQHLKHGGALNALSFCSNQAMSITEKVNSKLPKGISVQRISEKYRNPSDAPNAQEATILSAFQTLQDNHVVMPKYLIQKVNNNTYRYYKPLLISKKACLICHGNISKNPQLAKQIKKRYPLDKATGYKMGDLRGAVVVTIVK